MIYLLTGPVRSGKTTSLIEWAKGRNDVHGILTPDIKGKRVFMNIKTKTQFPMEATPGEETISVGRFSFSKKYFEQAFMVIRTAINKTGWLVIDEAGPLELKGQGFAPVLKELFSSRKNKIILVVREGIAQQVSNCFGLSVHEIKLIDTSSLIQLQ
jgi:nucleoside-triphosphatase THEP1